ncbi:MAG: hypothetical protein AB1483_04195 [Candidatus Zixiibacteriota bacterium]
MDASFSRIRAELAEPTDERLSELIDYINVNINPPSPVRSSDVLIRAMYIVSDEVNSFGGRFPAEELERLIELLVDSPVLVGHRKDKLPVARTFHAEIVNRGDKTWVKSYFYWLKSAKGALDLKENIDGGIYKECSIGFTYLFPECSICGEDIRTCRHEPFQKYPDNESGASCHFNYRQIERVLETSLVYRGAVRDTSISRQLDESDHDFGGDTATVISSTAVLDPSVEYLVVPHYDGIEVTVECADGRLSMATHDGETVKFHGEEHIAVAGLRDLSGASGVLIGFRGKERCSQADLEKYLEKGTGRVTRLELRLYPQEGVEQGSVDIVTDALTIKQIRHAYSGVSGLEECAGKMRTRGGVRVYPRGESSSGHRGYLYKPATESREGCGRFALFGQPDGSNAVLCLYRGGKTHQFVIRQFHFSRFMKGARFIADEVDVCSTAALATLAHGELLAAGLRDGVLLLEISGGIEGVMAICPIKINGVTRCLIRRVADIKSLSEESEGNGSAGL